jgi:peptidoglycan hydrolase-like protein with peptidoglycan-binding domain
MAVSELSPSRRRQRRPRRRRVSRRGVWVFLSVVAVAAVGVAVVWTFSGVRLVADGDALGRVELQPFAGSLASVHAQSADGRPIPLAVSHGRLTPRVRVSPGERVSLSVFVQRPGWESWALGADRRETLTVQTPVAKIANRWVEVAAGARAEVRFDTPVDRVSVPGASVVGRTVKLPSKAAAGSVALAAAARPWERLGQPVQVTWFPKSHRPVVLVTPGQSARINPLTPIGLTFSAPVSRVLAGRKPTLVPATTGRWTQVDGHTLIFRPSGNGMPFDSNFAVRLPSALVVADPTGANAHTSKSIRLSVAPASFLRLQQLLAQAGYLPLDWIPAHADAHQTLRSELAAAVDAPVGHFHWRYPHTPPELEALWKTGHPNEITRGAVMMFQNEHHLAVDGIAGPKVWRSLLADALAGKQRAAGYSYVYVHRNLPQLLTLWHNGDVVLTSPGNTGVPAAPTTLGTWPVFEHIPVGRMSGTNPDGTHYNDPGISWISYFHGGEALHAFNRASFGTPPEPRLRRTPTRRRGEGLALHTDRDTRHDRELTPAQISTVASRESSTACVTVTRGAWSSIRNHVSGSSWSFSARRTFGASSQSVPRTTSAPFEEKQRLLLRP